MKRKFTLTLILSLALGGAAIAGAVISIYDCMEWNNICASHTFSPNAMKYTQNIIFHASYWMGIAFICLCLFVMSLFWNLHRQRRLSPPTEAPSTEPDRTELQKLKVNIYTNDVFFGDIKKKGRHQTVALLNYLIQTDTHEVSYEKLNTLFHDNFFTGSPQSRRKVNNLRYEISDMLKETSLDLVKTPSDSLILIVKNRAFLLFNAAKRLIFFRYHFLHTRFRT
ncbi:MAG: hypothetical protein LUC45_09435 [Paraprevotella sp.]|nr:hypothetical protein [Paraprevotella sp.]